MAIKKKIVCKARQSWSSPIVGELPLILAGVGCCACTVMYLNDVRQTGRAVLDSWEPLDLGIVCGDQSSESSWLTQLLKGKMPSW